MKQKIIEAKNKAKEKGYFEIISICAAFVIFLFNLIVGIIYSSYYNFTISFYLLLLGIYRLIVFIIKKKEAKLTKKRFLLLSLLLIFINLVLIGPIILMILQKRKISYNIIIAISLAAYTTYKTVNAIMNLVKANKQEFNYFTLLSFVNFIDMLVSLITLSYSLIVVNNNGELGENSTLMIVVAWCIFAFIIISTILFTIFGFRYLIKKED